MPKRELLIVRRNAAGLLGVCRACNEQFQSGAADDRIAKSELTIMFNVHQCKPVDSSQNALRIVREATEGK
jgi:hypothetical protein